MAHMQSAATPLLIAVVVGHVVTGAEEAPPRARIPAAQHGTA